ncbi:MAG: phosphatase PAP2 family protein [Firmicutes bacterium]|nr:phosphatase PAP2 family protein [Bacillota bacterium]
MKNRNLLESLNRAAGGVIYCLRTQRNFRIHVFAAAAVLLLSLWFRISKGEFLLVLAAIFMVLITEVINTAVEATIDLITDRYHPLAATAKNLAAGAVILAAVYAVITGYIVFFPKIDPLVPKVISAVRDSPAYLSLIALVLVFLAVLVLKTRTGKGLPFSGGMPSGHAALGFAAATIIALLSNSGLVTGLALLIAFLLAESRVETKIHTPVEAVLGGLLGIFLTLLIFQLIPRLW